MSLFETFDGRVAVAILAMAAATYLIRGGGFWLMGHLPLTVRMRRMLEALPGAMVAAIVVPLAVRSGPAAIVALAATGGVMMTSRSDFLAVATGVAVAAAVRAAGF